MKKLSLTVVAASAAALVLIGAAPASAAGSAIDPGDSLYSISCDDAYGPWQLFGVDSTSAFSTPIGAGTGSVEDEYPCAFQPAWNAETGVSYYIQTLYDNFQQTGSTSSLATIDVTTGLSTTIGEFYYEADGTYYPQVDAIAIGKDGKAFAVFEGELFSLDLGTAELTYINSTLPDVYAFAANPTTGDFYVVDSEGYTYKFDVTNGAVNYLGQVTLAGNESVYSLQIDEAGTFWIEVDVFNEGDPTDALLYSFTEATITAPVLSGEFTDDPYYTEAILIIPGAPVLPATGADTSMAPIAAGAAGALALLGAAVLVMRRRRAA